MILNAPPDLSDSFFIRWLLMAQRLDADPLDLVRVSYSESGCRANAHNVNGDGSGLIGFMPDTLKLLGWTKGHAAFRALPAEDQVPYVERYFRPYAHRMGVAGQKIPQLVTEAHIYTACFLPARLPDVVAAGEGWDGVELCAKNGLLAWAYKDNTILDVDRNGIITAGDMHAWADKQCQGVRYDAIVYRMRLARGERPPPFPEPAPTEKDLSTLSPSRPAPAIVRQYQERLAALGYAPGPIDGIHGPHTDAAVRAFQCASGLVEDGIVGPLTAKALFAPEE